MADTTQTPEEIAAATAAAEKKAEGNKPLNAAGVNFIKKAIGATDKPADDKKKADEKPKTDDEDKSKEGDKEKGKEKPKAKTKPAASPAAPSATEIATAVAEAVTKATAAKPKDEKKEETADDPLFSDPTEKRKLTVLAHMEKTNGDKYKGVTEKYKASLKKLAAYADKWELDNPGKTFDEAAPEHEDFVKAVSESVEWDEDDFTDARIDLTSDAKAEEKLKKELAPLREDIDEFKLDRKLRTEKPKIDAAAATAGNHFWSELGAGFEGIIDEKGGIDGEKLKALQESNPIAYDESIAAVTTLESASATLYKLTHGLESFNDKSPLHISLATFASASEERMMRLPAEKQLDAEGRKFVTKDEYLGMNDRQKARHWTFESEDLSLLLAADIAKKAKEKITLEEKRFADLCAKRGIEYTPVAAKPAADKNGKSKETPGDDDEKPDSPSTNGTPRMAAAKGKGTGGASTPVETFAKRFIG